MADESLTWDLRIGADTSGADKMDAALGKISEHVKDAHGKMGDFEHGARDGFGRAGKHAEDFSHKVRYEFGTLGHSINYAKIELKELAEAFGAYEAIEGIKKLGEKVVELGEDIFATAAKAERFDASFKLALGAEPGTQILEYIEKIGKHTEFTQEQLKGMNLELAKSGFKGSGLARGTEAAIDLAAMSANPQEGAQSAIEALRRIQTTGRLEARALMPFGINQRDLFAEISRETGYGTAAVKKKLEQGTLDIDTTLNSLYSVITKKTGKALGGAGADMEHLFTTRLKNLKEIPDLLFEKISGTKGFEAVSDFVGKLGDAFDPSGPAGAKISEGLSGIVDAFGDSLKGIDLKELASDFGSAVREIGSDVAPAVALIKELGHDAGVAAHWFGELFDIWQRYTPPGWITSFVGKRLASNMAEREGLVPPIATERMKGFDYEATRAKLRARRLGEDTAAGFSEGTKAAAFDITDAMGAMGDRAEGGLRKRLDMHSPSKIFEDLGSMVGEGFAIGVDQSAARVDSAIARMVATPSRPGGGGAPSISMPVSVVIHAQTGATADEIGDVFADRIAEVVPGTLKSALDQLALQGGSAR